MAISAAVPAGASSCFFFTILRLVVAGLIVTDMASGKKGRILASLLPSGFLKAISCPRSSVIVSFVTASSAFFAVPDVWPAP